MAAHHSLLLLTALPFMLLQQASSCNSSTEDIRETETDGGSYWVVYAPDPDPIPVEEYFALDVSVYSGADHTQLVPGARIEADAWMPDHNHGMISTPVVTANGDGTFRVDKMYFQMTGEWEILVDVIMNGQTETASFMVDCCDQ